MNNRAFRVDDNSINSFTPSYAGTQGAIATHSNLSATTCINISKSLSLDTELLVFSLVQVGKLFIIELLLFKS